MATTTLWDSLLKPFFQTFLINQDELENLHRLIDWSAGEAQFAPTQPYPDYYRQNFHGITGGYLTVTAALTYDPITRYVLPPNEEWVRQGLIDQIGGQPRRILDLGCGTGSLTLALKEHFPQADVMGLDLSPQMLTMADYKAQQRGLKMTWYQGLAEQTPFSRDAFDLISIALLFHETPPAITQAILQECFRLLSPGGQLLILDGNQAQLRHNEWLTQVFEEPYIQAFARGDLNHSLQKAGFEQVKTEEHWWFHQISQGRKPLPIQDRTFHPDSALNLTDNPSFSF